MAHLIQAQAIALPSLAITIASMMSGEGDIRAQITEMHSLAQRLIDDEAHDKKQKATNLPAHKRSTKELVEFAKTQVPEEERRLWDHPLITNFLEGKRGDPIPARTVVPKSKKKRKQK